MDSTTQCLASAIALPILAAIGISGIAAVWWYQQQITLRQQSLQALRNCQPEFCAANAAFAELVNGNRYCNHRRLVEWQNRWQPLVPKLRLPYQTIRLPADLTHDIATFLDHVEHAPAQIEQYNRAFSECELVANQKLFDAIESNPLDPQQREAIVHDEDSNLVVAGAGTGKTTTIAGKTAYLLRRLQVRPDEILLLAFTRKAAGEMAERIQSRLGQALDVNTFHKFGLNIIAQVEGRKPSLFMDGDETRLREAVNELFRSAMQQPAYLQVVTDYFLYYLRPYKPQTEFASEGAYFNYLKAHAVQTLKAKATNTYEDVRSLEEADIANFLYLNGVEYRYEADYAFPTADQQHRQYRPDFYLPDYKIYIEHFAVGRDGSVPDWFEGVSQADRRQRYEAGMKWKRATHQRHGTTLVETYSFYKAEGELISKLTSKLLAQGAVLQPREPGELIELLEASKDIPVLVELLTTFLSLFKANLYTLADLTAKAAQSDAPNRSVAFIAVFDPVYQAYEARLRDAGQIDFSDMLRKAAEYVLSRRYISPYRYILIDEFQDLSLGRYKLVRALLDQNPEQKLFCVGDDWQSIYRFTGSDVALMLDFEQYFGFTKKTFLERTYRFNDKIAAFSSDFIQKNPRQSRKNLKTMRQVAEPAHEVLVKSKQEDAEPLRQALQAIDGLAQSAPGSKVFILGRYNFIVPVQLKMLQKQFPRLQIEFLTAHRSKGLEADYVIIDGLVAGKYGFPTEMMDDPLINMVLTAPDNFPNSEERRLFYVALTRARHKVYLLTEAAQPSAFVSELAPKGLSLEICPKCQAGRLVQKKNSKNASLFLGCTNFPLCRYTTNVASMVNLGRGF